MTTKYALFVLPIPLALFACSKTNSSADSAVSLDSPSAAPAESGPGPDMAEPDAAVYTCITIADDLIADFTVDNSLNQVDGRQGGFYVYGDGSTKGQFDPPSVACQAYPIDTTTGNPNCSGPGSFHVKASNWGVWGAALGADFVPKIIADAGDCDTGVKGTYDASKYRGISFWAKATAPLTGVQVSFPDVYTDGSASFAGLPGGAGLDFTSCVYSAGAMDQGQSVNCSPYLVKFGASGPYQDYKIDTTWRRFDVFFADTYQDPYNPGFHTAANTLDTSHLTSMAIQVNAIYVNGAPTPNDFEIWVDDVYFIR
ncbi:MAG: hypothetical protein ABSF35_16300 [Polyangia bacterium]|jgi:hypothetical protein